MKFMKVSVSTLASWLASGQPKNKARVMWSGIPGYDEPVHGFTFQIKSGYTTATFFIKDDEIYYSHDA